MVVKKREAISLTMANRMTTKTKEELTVIARNLINGAITPYFLSEGEIIRELGFFYDAISDHEFVDEGKNQNKIRKGWLMNADNMKMRKRYPTKQGT